MEDTRRVHLRPRLVAAVQLLGQCDTVADIGCDHGRLSCALVQQGVAKRCIAVDVSELSLEKARALAALTGVSDRVETRRGDGFSAIVPGEADAVALLGMGGTLMARLLNRCERPLGGASLAVLQPMRAADDIRRYLFENGYPVLDDRVVLDAGRLYQVFSAGAPNNGAISLPNDWPEDCFLVGYTAFARRDPLLLTLVERMLAQREARLKKCSVPSLRHEADQLRQIQDRWPSAHERKGSSSCAVE